MWADQAERLALEERVDALVWEAVSEITHEESTLSVVYQAFMSVATMLAACGAVLDSAILIVGAMAIGPEFGSLAGLSVAVVQRRARPAVRSVMALMVGFAMAMVRTTGFSLLMSGLGLFRAALASGPTVGTGGGSMSEKIFV